MYTQLMHLMRKPALYERGAGSIWTDEHISKGMLAAHLNPDWDAATRKHDFIRASARWVAEAAPPERYPALLDLGCGPGLYAERFAEAGYRVTGADISARSVDYARASARAKGLPIEYRQLDYLTLADTAQFDLVTLIYNDFGVLSPGERAGLLSRIHTALKPGGRLILDVNTPCFLDGREESTGWVCTEGGFFCAGPHVLYTAFYLYEERRTYCDHHVVLTERGVRSYTVFEHTFTADELARELRGAGFGVCGLYDSAAGAVYSGGGTELCVVAEREAP